ncbi:hypothetical protein NMG60_11036103 [Bertholletia excelsa]
MEDWNMLASDCVVITCCCQCLILQIVLFVFLGLPHKLVQKLKQYTRKKLGRGKRESMAMGSEVDRCGDPLPQNPKGSVTIEGEGFVCGCCMGEVDRVLEGLAQNGEFAFGSFWGKHQSGRSHMRVATEEFDYNIVQNHLIEIVCSS